MSDKFSKRRIVTMALASFLVSLLLIAFDVALVCAIPSLTVHTNDADRIEWEYDDNGQEDGSACHNHRSPRSFGGWDFRPGRPSYDPNRPYIATAGVWDGETVRETNAGVFDVGHGFINEFSWLLDFDGSLGGEDRDIPDYCFSGPWDANALDMVDEAFIEWSAISSDKPDLLTGIEFTRTTNETAAEIVLLWQDIVSSGETYHPSMGGNPNPGRVTVIFDNDPGNGGWYFPKDPSGCPNNQYHFYSTALHEIGHVVGLGDQSDLNNVMVSRRQAGLGPATWNDVNGNGVIDEGELTGTGPAFGGLDANSIEGALDLYSIPAPDWGDAPDPYPVKWEQRGPYCPQFGFEWLGDRPATGISTTTGERVPNQVDHDVPDDGVVFAIGAGGPGAGRVTVTISVKDRNSPRYAGIYELYLAIWIDWNRDNDWEPNELVVLPDRLSPRTWTTNTITKQYIFDVPVRWSETWARARLAYTTTGGYLAGPTGDEGLLPHLESPDNGGEIEDYKLTPPPSYPPPCVGGEIVLMAPPMNNITLSPPWVTPIIILSTIFAVASIATLYKRKHIARKSSQ